MELGFLGKGSGVGPLGRGVTLGGSVRKLGGLIPLASVWGALSSAYSRLVTHFNHHQNSLVTCPCDPLIAPTCLPDGWALLPHPPMSWSALGS